MSVPLVDRLPALSGTRPSTVYAVLAAVFTVLVAAVSSHAVVAGTLALGLLAVALATGRRFALALAGPALLATPGVAALTGGSAAVVLVAVPAAVVAWDASERAVRLRAVGGSAVSPRAELVHAAGTTAVVAVAAICIWLVRSLPVIDASPLAVALLAAGAFALAASLHR